MCKLELLDEALQVVDVKHRQGTPTTQHMFSCFLQGCAKQTQRELASSRRVHALMISNALGSATFLEDGLIRHFTLCGRLLEANLVFCKVVKPSVYTWHAIILAHAKHGESGMVLELYHKMYQEGIMPERFIYPYIMKACGSTGIVWQGRMIHGEIIQSGVESDAIIGSTLVDMYVKCGCFVEAHNVLDRLSCRNVVSWGAMIAGYAQHGHGVSALQLFDKMQQQGVRPDKVAFLCILKACGSIEALCQGKLIHYQIIKNGLQSDVFIGSALVDMYAKCGNLDVARNVFDGMPTRNLVSWGAMISGYVQHGHSAPALELFVKMQQEGMMPNEIIFSSVLKACGIIRDLRSGKWIHAQIGILKLNLDLVVGNSLVDMYSKCGSLDGARIVFDSLPNRNGISWGAMIVGYVQQGQCLPALELFNEMLQNGIQPNKVTLSCILKACGSLGALAQGKVIHDQILRSGLASDVVVASALIDMYAKCGSLKEARKLFDELRIQELVSWGAMIWGYAQHGQPHHALKLYEKMQQQAIEPNKVIFLCVLRACSAERAFGYGKRIHGHIVSTGLESDVVVGSSLVDMYAKCGNLEEARKLFDKLLLPDVVSWVALIVGYINEGYSLSALRLFEDMQQLGICPNEAVFPCIVKACGSIGALVQGMLVHDQIIRRGLQSDMVIGHSLIGMYSKSGSLKDAHKVFDKLPMQDLISWGLLIAGYAQQGNYRLVGQCLVDMQGQGLKPHGMIYSSILSTCSHAGQVEEGHQYFKAFSCDDGITPRVENFNCMVDLLSRAGCLEEAEQLLQTMPVLPDIIGWSALLSACRTYGNMDLGRQCFNQVLQLDPSVTTGYVLMSSMYAESSMWEESHQVQELRQCAAAWKKPGKAWIEFSDALNEFIVGDKTHPTRDIILANLNRWNGLTKVEGYVPQVDFSA